MANIYGKIDKYEEAEKHFLTAIKLFEDRVKPIHYANLGKIVCLTKFWISIIKEYIFIHTNM